MPEEYLFRGLRRSTGEPVAGHITAPSEDAVYGVLDNHDIIVDAVGTDIPLFTESLHQALEEAGVRIRLDQMPRRHEGHLVWVIDHDKVRDRVMRLVREAVADDDARQRIALVLQRVFERRQDPVAEAPVESLDAMELRAKIGRLTAAMGKMEKAMATMEARERSSTRVEYRRSSPQRVTRDRTQDAVLLEIFEHNLELRGAPPPRLAAAG